MRSHLLLLERQKPVCGVLDGAELLKGGDLDGRYGDAEVVVLVLGIAEDDGGASLGSARPTRRWREDEAVVLIDVSLRELCDPKGTTRPRDVSVRV